MEVIKPDYFDNKGQKMNKITPQQKYSHENKNTEPRSLNMIKIEISKMFGH